MPVHVLFTVATVASGTIMLILHFRTRLVGHMFHVLMVLRLYTQYFERAKLACLFQTALRSLTGLGFL